MKKHSVTYRDFQCPVCGVKIVIPKKSSKRTKTGHIKTMDCWKCGKSRQFVQFKYGEEFD